MSRTRISQLSTNVIALDLTQPIQSDPEQAVGVLPSAMDVGDQELCDSEMDATSEMDGGVSAFGDGADSNFDFSPQREPIVLGICMVVLVAFVAASLQSGPWMMFLAIGLAGFIVATLLLFQQKQRWDEAAKAYRESQTTAKRWHRRLQKLQDNSEQSETALSQMADGVVMLSPEGNIRLINIAACRLFGLSWESNFLGRPFFEVVRIPETTEALRAAQQGDLPQCITVEVVNGADVKPVRVQIARITDRPESSMLLTVRDESRIHELEAIRREFVANVSHEIKTPIAAIKGYVETIELAMDDDPESATHFLGQIQGQCVRLERLVADLMQVARAQSGRQHLRFTTVSMGEIVGEAMRALRPIAEARSISVDVEEMDDVFVEADHEATLTIANNLISNAIHYTSKGGNVLVRCTRSGEFWSLIVQDDGVGIPESEHDRIFERFYRVDRNRSSASGGTGIGLAMVKNLTVAQHGNIRLDSAPGEGATFEIRLPAALTNPNFVETSPTSQQDTTIEVSDQPVPASSAF